MFVMGLFPNYFLRKMDASVEALVQTHQAGLLAAEIIEDDSKFAENLGSEEK